MYCKHCGKELSDEAVMCPNCGTPTMHRAQPKKSAAESEPAPAVELKGKTGAIIAFTCALIALLCCIFFVSYTIAYGRIRIYSNHFSVLGAVFGYAMGLLTIATALLGLLGGIYGVIHAAGVRKYRALSTAAIAISASALIIFFMLYCVFYAMRSA